jgi:hypothetical protein
MGSPFPVGRIALALLAALLLAAPSPADNDLPPPAAQRPKISKLTIDVNGTQTVHYTVQNGTPRLRTVFQTLEWAENEMTIVQQLQQLKLDYVRNERTHELQSGNATAFGPRFGSGPGYYPPSRGHESSLKMAISGQLAEEGTPEAAIRAIQLLEKAETEAADELKRLAPEDRKALEARTDELRTFVASLAPNARPAPAARGSAAGAPRVGSASGTNQTAPADEATRRAMTLAAVGKAIFGKTNVIQGEREALSKARDRHMPLLQGTPAERQKGIRQMQAARQRYSAAPQSWSTAMRSWNDVSSVTYFSLPLLLGVAYLRCKSMW